jgi:hypothetical protein
MIKIKLDLFMTTALLQECLIGLRQQRFADDNSALQLSTLFCPVQMSLSAHAVVRRRYDNETRSSTHRLIGRLCCVSLLISSLYSRISGLVSHSRIILQQRQQAGESL